MRNAFIEELVLAAEKNPRIALVVGDLGYGVVEPFARRFPNRFFNSGVAEQNMMGFSAGLASEGFHVFVYSIANFPTFRCAEQIRNDVDYHQLPVTIVAVGGGLAYGNLGYSHHAIQDMALMRTMPSMLIAAPGDPMEVRSCMRYLIEHPQPSYLRLGKAGEACLHDRVPSVAPGEWVKIAGRNGDRVAILSTGATLPLALEQAQQISSGRCTVYSLPLWSMKDKLNQSAMVRQYERVITMEDHLADGGFGSWLCESVNGLGDLPARILTKALASSVAGKVGKQTTLNKLGGLIDEIRIHDIR
jgi:transketolase